MFLSILYKRTEPRYLFENICYLVILFGILFGPATSGGVPEANKSFLDVNELLDAWEAHYGSIQSMAVKYSERSVQTTGPNNEGIIRHSQVERKQKGKHYYIRSSNSEQGFANANSISEGAFNGAVSKLYLSTTRTGTIDPGLSGSNFESKNVLAAVMMMSRYYNNDEAYPNGTPYLSMILRDRIAHGQVQVFPELAIVAGELCHVIEAVVGNDVRRFWIAHGKDMLPMRFEVHRDGKVTTKIEVLKLDKTVSNFGEFWYPSEVTRELTSPGRDPVKTELTVQEFVPHASFPSETFDVVFPNGTWIHDKVAGLRYVMGGDIPMQESKMDDPPSSAPEESDQDAIESSDESEPSVLGGDAGPELNDTNDQTVVQQEGSARQALPEERTYRRAAMYASLGAMVLGALVVTSRVRRHRNS